MSSPWGKIAKPEAANLTDIMSEEVAKDLQEKEYEKVSLTSKPTVTPHEEYTVPSEFLVDGDLETDAEIAKMLQQQFDKEYDEMLKRTENKVNGTNKISISLSNYRRAPTNSDFESDSEEEELEDLRERKEWDRFDSVNKDFTAIPPCGYLVKDGNMVTKHDGTMSGRKNACKMMSFPPEFETGDGAGFDLKLSNKVFNSLRAHSKQEQQRNKRVHDKKEDHATAEFGIDEFTRLLLYKLINNQVLEKVNGIISIGKEALVLHGELDENSERCDLPKECVIKVFKTTLSEFKQRDKYIKDDYRFKDRIGKQNARKTVHLWAEKEMHNLNRVRAAGIPCPEVVALKKHLLLMTFIGKNHKPAPKLKDAILSDAEYLVAYNQVIEAMTALYNKANLIHADLSEYNILWYESDCYLIDVAQSVEPNHGNAFHFLYRDCGNISNFFSRKGVAGVETADQIFRAIVGCDFGDKIGLLELQENIKMKPHLVDRPGVNTDYRFDSAWSKSKEIAPTAEA